MNSIEKAVSHTMVVEKSTFTAYLFPLSKKEEVEKFLLQIRKREKGATHICYGYIFSPLEGSSDDGEPSGSAGISILQVLQKKNLDHVLCVVVRYFGGIKLGVGGLYRAYANAVKEAVSKASIFPFSLGYQVEILFPYSQIKKIDALLKGTTIIEKKFDVEVLYTFLIEKEEYHKRKDSLFYFATKVTICQEVFLRAK